MSHSFAKLVLLAGNFITGLAILAPAGMLAPLAEGLSVGIEDAGRLVTYGAIVLCLGAPLMAWATAGIPRRWLLSGALMIVAAGQIASALAPDYGTVVAARLVQLAFAAVFTPQAAATIAEMVPENARPAAIATVFLGWSLSFAAGLPIVTWLSAWAGWRAVFWSVGAGAMVAAMLVALALPGRVSPPRLVLAGFLSVLRSRPLLKVLLASLLFTAGQLTIFLYLAPLLAALTGAGPHVAGLFFGLFGGASLLGSVVAARMVTKIAPRPAFVLALTSTLAGAILWSVGAGETRAMAVAVALLGCGFAWGNAMQQARLNREAPDLTGASVALNTSVIYIGRAIGSATGGWILAQGAASHVGWAALVMLTCCAVVVAASRDGRRGPSDLAAVGTTPR